MWEHPRTKMEQELARAFCVVDEKICDAINSHDLKKAEELTKKFESYSKKTYKGWLKDINSYRTAA